jgi:hypothetical protein
MQNEELEALVVNMGGLDGVSGALTDDSRHAFHLPGGKELKHSEASNP